MKKTVITAIVNTQNNYMSLCVCVLNEQNKKKPHKRVALTTMPIFK